MKTLYLGGLLSFAGKSQLRMCQRRGQWILDCSMGLLMDILGLVDGVIDFVVEAWNGRAQLQ